MGSGEVLKRLTILLTVNDAATAQLATVSSTMRSFAGVTNTTTGQLAKMGQRFAQVGRALVSFLIIRTIGVQFGRFISLMFEGNQVLEKATASLQRLGGSLGYAKKQIDFIRQTAMRAPFDFQSILGASRLLVAYGRDLQTYLPMLLDWASALGATSGELEGYAAAMGKIMAGSPYVMRILTTRAVGLDQWKAALEQTNAALPKTERYAQAMTIALERFEGQAAVLAKTMAGLRTNIRDVWVEITREIGLSMFTRIRNVLFELYEGMRDIADNQKEKLYEIGDVFGLWTARLIVIVRKSAELPQIFKSVAGVAKNLAVFVLGRSMVMALVRIGLHLRAAVLSFRTLGTVGRSTVAVMNLLSIAVGIVVAQYAAAKVAAIDFRIAIGDVGAGLQIIEDFLASDEKIFTREQVSALRGFELGIKKISGSLGEHIALVERWRASDAWNIFSKQDRDIALANFRGILPYVSEEVYGPLEALVEDYGAMVDQVFGDPTWTRQMTDTIAAIKELEQLPTDLDPAKYAEHVQSVQRSLDALLAPLEKWRALSKSNEDSSLGVAVNYETQELALKNIALLMEAYEASQLGVAGAAVRTAEATKAEIMAWTKGLVPQELDLSGWVTAYQAMAKLSSDIAQTEADRVKGLKEAFEAQMGGYEATTRVAKLQSELTDNVQIYRDALTEVITAMEAWANDPATKLTAEQWAIVREALLQYRVDLKGAKDETVELAFSTQAAFSLWQQALSSIVNLVDAIGDGAQSMEEAFGNAIQSMLKWLGKLMLQMVIISILMQALNLSSGGMTGWGGALSVILGGGIGSAGRAFGGFKGGPQLAGAGIGGFPDVTQRTRSRSPSTEQTVIQINGDVLDGEHFMRLVDTANYKLQRRKGGGV